MPDHPRHALIVHFAPRAHALVDAVFVLVKAIETEFALLLGEREFEGTRDALLELADAIDPSDAFASVDDT